MKKTTRSTRLMSMLTCDSLSSFPDMEVEALHAGHPSIDALARKMTIASVPRDCRLLPTRTT